MKAILKMHNNQKGSTMIETVMVMTVLILFGVTIYTLIYSGANTQERIMKEKDAQIAARIALSYINVRLRQNDEIGKIGVEKINLTGEDAIVIKERTLENQYDTWIYCYEGKLLECLVDPEAEPSVVDSFVIVEADGLTTKLNPERGSITNTVYFYYDDALKKISSTINLRSY